MIAPNRAQHHGDAHEVKGGSITSCMHLWVLDDMGQNKQTNKQTPILIYKYLVS
jgi:hypothetical protein